MKKYILIIIPILLTSCWFNPNDKAWIDPIVMKFSEYDFKTERDSTDWFMTYIGEQETVSYKFADTKEWLSIENYHGHINKDEQKLLKFYIDRNKLAEGINEDTIKVYINEKHERHIIIKATGVAALEITPKEIDFGLTSSIKTLSLKSLSGDRMYIISTSDDWLKVDQPYVFIGQGDTANIDITCNRKIMNEGKYHGYITIESQEKTYSCVLDVYATKPTLNHESKIYDVYLISISNVYRDQAHNVCMELSFENTSNLFRTLTFNAVAIDINGNSYNSYSHQIDIKKNSTVNHTITFSGVPDDITGFQSIILKFNTSDTLKFNDINF